jgi:hypothetical protein
MQTIALMHIVLLVYVCDQNTKQESLCAHEKWLVKKPGIGETKRNKALW